jgi:hypothetical protein
MVDVAPDTVTAGAVHDGAALPPRSFQIVPVRGLPIVAVVLSGLVMVIATNTLWGIDFFHVVGGGLWTALDVRHLAPCSNRVEMKGLHYRSVAADWGS